ncbi:adenylate/guanylate cyclase domain-containing protein [Bradyrhizobium sp. LTSPM299]|uniref:adenylate/guanylate cyclase domain-containing protein n=1 Tax=Bradyrhizobium sp. LTSPM299 TaxID=1619233 RepID=UPI000AE6BF71|nr:adenylate/guanylate cyclase domain-containing protein [Bradyrhizobium sp. LTSPM299]
MISDIEEFVTGERSEFAEETDRVLATVLFTDIVNSTTRAIDMGDRRWRELLDSHDRLAKQTVERHRGRLVKSTGDGILATFDGPGRGVRCALALGAAARQIGLPLRAGLHTGEIEVRGDHVGGIAVHVAARVMGQSGADQVLVSRVVTDLVAGTELKFAERGLFALKGIPGFLGFVRCVPTTERSRAPNRPDGEDLSSESGPSRQLVRRSGTSGVEERPE